MATTARKVGKKQLCMLLAFIILFSLIITPAVLADDGIVVGEGGTYVMYCATGAGNKALPIAGAVAGVDYYDSQPTKNTTGMQVEGTNSSIFGVSSVGRIGNNSTTNWIKWSNVDLRGGITQWELCYGTDTASSKSVEVLVSKPGAGIAGAVSLGVQTFTSVNGGWTTPTYAPVYPVANPVLDGYADVYFRFASDGYNYIAIRLTLKGATTFTPPDILGDAHYNSDASPMIVVSDAVTGITGADEGSWIKYSGIDLKEGSISNFKVEYDTASSADRAVDVLVAAPGAPIDSAVSIGAVYPFSATSAGTLVCTSAKPHGNGVKDIYVRFKGEPLAFRGVTLQLNDSFAHDIGERKVLTATNIGTASYAGGATPTAQPDGFLSGIPSGSWFKFEGLALKAGFSSFDIMFAADSPGTRTFEVWVANTGFTIVQAEFVGSASASVTTGGLNSTVGAGRAWAYSPTSKLVGGTKDIYVRVTGGDISFGSLAINIVDGEWWEPQLYVETEARPARADVAPYLRTYHDKPSEVGEGVDGAAAPLGNGHMGALVYGGIFDDTIVINEKTIWSGGPGASSSYNGGHNSYNSYSDMVRFINDPTFQLSSTPRTHTTLRQVREAWDTSWANYNGSATGSAPSPSVPAASGTGTRTASSAIETDLFGASKNGNTSFGNYQELGKILLDDPDVPSISSSYIKKEPATNRNGSSGELVSNLFQNNTNKWYAQSSGTSLSNPTWITWGYDAPITVAGYSIRTGNDVRNRDPATYTLFGSLDGANFTAIDIRSGVDLGATRQAWVEFTTNQAGTHSYKFFKLEIYATYASGNNPQMTNFVLKTGSATTTRVYGWGTGPDDHIPDLFDNQYRREVNVETGITTVSYKKESGGSFKKEYFINYPDNVFAMKMSADKEFTQTFSLSTLHSNATISIEYGNILQLVGRPSSHGVNGLWFFQQAKIIPIGPNATVSDNGRAITVHNANEIVVLMTAGTNYQQCMDNTFNYFYDREEAFQNVKDRLEYAVSKGYNHLLRRHLDDYQGLFGRVDFRVNGANGNPIPIPTRPTNQLVGTSSGSNGYPNATDNEKRYIEMLYYQHNRYLLIACSRAGSLPANLQGIWAVGLSPPWNADYHTNINVQMNYWPAQSTNLAETHVPMVEYVKAQVPRGQITANFYHYAMDNSNPANRNVLLNRPVRGWICYHENNIYGNTAPGNSGASYCPGGGTWMSQDVWEYYQFTQDIEYLKKYYETLHGAAIFWVDNLWRFSQTGELMANPSYSPEHGPYSPGATSEQAVVWESFEMTQLAHAALLASGDPAAIALANKYASEVAEIAYAQSQLAGPKIGSQSQFMEWSKETSQDVTGDGQHRHTNHLFYLHPGTRIVPGRSTQEDLFVDAMKVTLNTRTDASTGWSMGWKLNFWARLREGDRAHKLAQDLLTSGTLPNLFDTHAPFQIDGNFGGLSGMTEMLLQSHGGYIELLPALPAVWAKTGHMHGLKARGNVRVDMNWVDGKLTTAVLASETNAAQTVTIKYPGITKASVLNGTTPVSFEKIGLDMISFTAQPGVDYTIVSEGTDYTARNAFVKQNGNADRIIGTATVDGGALVDVASGAQALYKMDFGTTNKAGSVALSLAMGDTGTPGKIEIWNGIPNSEFAEKLAVIDEKMTGGWDKYETIRVPLLCDISGVKEIYVCFVGGSGLASNMESIIFYMKQNPTVKMIGLGNATSGTVSAAQYGSDKVYANSANARILYRNIDLRKGVISLQVRYATTSASRTITVYAMEPGATFNANTATVIGVSGNLATTSSTNVYTYFTFAPSTTAAGATGVKDIYVVFNNTAMYFWGLTLTLNNADDFADLTALENLYASAPTVQGLYTDETWSAFLPAYIAAGKVLDAAPYVTQGEADAAEAALSSALAALKMYYLKLADGQLAAITVRRGTTYAIRVDTNCRDVTFTSAVPVFATVSADGVVTGIIAGISVVRITDTVTGLTINVAVNVIN